MSKPPHPAGPTPPAAPGGASGAAYLVLGMHRSGTSAVTQLLALAGASLPAHVMPGDEHNAKGYFEPWKIAVFNDERLRAAGSAWDDPFAFPCRPLPDAEEADWRERAGALFDEEFAGARFPLMKDPRATVLFPIWRGVLRERGMAARCVIPVRHPLAVAGSLKRRDGFTEAKSALVWSAYMLAAEAYTRDLPRAFVGYDALLADWRGVVGQIEAAHGAPLPGLTAAAGKRIDAFLTADLRHNAGDTGMADLGWIGEIAQGVFDWFEAKAAGGDPDRTLLDTAAARLAKWQAEIGALVTPAAHALAAARADLLEAHRRTDALEAIADELRRQMAREREILEAGWRTDLQRVERTVADQAYVLDRINADFDAVLSDD